MRLVENEHGMTLIELLVTLTVLTIIISIATPNFTQWRAKMEAKRIKHSLFTTLKQAKSESFINRQHILFCLSSGNGICDKNGDKALLLFIDRNGNKRFDDLSDHLIRKEALNLKYGTVKLRVGRGQKYIKFFGETGQPRGYNGHIKYCPLTSNTSLMYQVSFNQRGIIKFKPNHQHPTDC